MLAGGAARASRQGKRVQGRARQRVRPDRGRRLQGRRRPRRARSRRSTSTEDQARDRRLQGHRGRASARCATTRRCDVAPQSLVGEYYVDCQPGTSGERARARAARSRSSARRAPSRPTSSTTSCAARTASGCAASSPSSAPPSPATPRTSTPRCAAPCPALRETNRVLAILADQNQVLADLARDADAVIGDAGRQPQRRRRAGSSRRATPPQASAERDRDIAAGFQRLPDVPARAAPDDGRARRDRRRAGPGAAQPRRRAPTSSSASSRTCRRSPRRRGPAIDVARRGVGDRPRGASEARAPTVAELDEVRRGVPELGKNLAIILEHLDDRELLASRRTRAAPAARATPASRRCCSTSSTRRCRRTSTTATSTSSRRSRTRASAPQYADIKAAKEHAKECSQAPRPEPGRHQLPRRDGAARATTATTAAPERQRRRPGAARAERRDARRAAPDDEASPRRRARATARRAAASGRGPSAGADGAASAEAAASSCPSSTTSCPARRRRRRRPRSAAAVPDASRTSRRARDDAGRRATSSSSTTSSAHEPPAGRIDRRQPRPRRGGHAARRRRRGVPRLQREQRPAVRPDADAVRRAAQRRRRQQGRRGPRGRLPHRRRRGPQARPAAATASVGARPPAQARRVGRAVPEGLARRRPAALAAGAEDRPVRARRQRASSSRDGDARPGRRSREIRTDLDELYDALRRADARGRAGATSTGFGNAFAGRGADLNDDDPRAARAARRPAAGHGEPRRRPRPTCRRFFKELGDTTRVVAPVVAASTRASFTHAGRHVRRDRPRPGGAQGDDRQEPADDGRLDRLVPRPAPVPARHRARCRATSTPPSRDLRAALPPVNDALEVGTPVLAPLGRAQRATCRTRWARCATWRAAPTTNGALRGLTATVTTLQPQLRFLGPYITVCNYWNIFWTFAAEHFTAPDADRRRAARAAQQRRRARTTTSRTRMGANEPATGRGVAQPAGHPPVRRTRNAAGGNAIKRDGTADCTPGQQGYPYGANQLRRRRRTSYYKRAVVDQLNGLLRRRRQGLDVRRSSTRTARASGRNRPRVPEGQTFTDVPGGRGALTDYDEAILRSSGGSRSHEAQPEARAELHDGRDHRDRRSSCVVTYLAFTKEIPFRGQVRRSTRSSRTPTSSRRARRSCASPASTSARSRRSSTSATASRPRA